MDSDWRTPSDSEAELITAWTLNVLLSGPSIFLKDNIFELAIGAAVLLLVTSIKLIPLLIIYAVPMIIVFLLMWRSGSRKRKQLLSGDYLIMDSFVIAKSVSRYRSAKYFFVYVKIPYGMDREIKVSSKIYNAVSANTRGFLVRYGKNEPVHKGVAKEFFPAISLDE